MFFRKPKPHEEVRLSELRMLSVDAFEQSMPEVMRTEQRSKEEIAKSISIFERACSEFEALEIEPNTENMYMPNINSIKAQKAAYSKTMLGIISSLSGCEYNGESAYERLMEVRGKVDKVLSKILQSNGSFRQVIYSYSNNIGDFKRAYSILEEVSKRAGLAIGRYEPQYSRLQRLHSSISELESLYATSSELRASISSLENMAAEGHTTAAGSTEETRIHEKISLLRKRIAEESSHVATIYNEVEASLAQIRRAAKKYDHISAEKEKISSIIDNPERLIREKGTRESLIRLVKDMRLSISESRIDIKNPEDVINTIDRVLNLGIDERMDEISSWRDTIKSQQQELYDLEKTKEELEAGMRSIEKSKESKEQMEEKLRAIEKETASSKSALEESFMNLYGRKIDIIPDQD